MASSPAVANGLVFAGSYDGKMYAVNASSGGLVWSYLTDDMVVSSPAVVRGVVYFGSYDHMIYAVGTLTGDTISVCCAADFAFSIYNCSICGFSDCHFGVCCFKKASS